EEAADEYRCIHVLVRAAIAQAHEARLRIEDELVPKAAGGKTTDPARVVSRQQRRGCGRELHAPQRGDEPAQAPLEFHTGTLSSSRARRAPCRVSAMPLVHLTSTRASRPESRHSRHETASPSGKAISPSRRTGAMLSSPVSSAIAASSARASAGATRRSRSDCGV